jgi:hypothetical protein
MLERRGLGDRRLVVARGVARDGLDGANCGAVKRHAVNDVTMTARRIALR